MDKERIEKKLGLLKADKDNLRKKIATIGGPATSELSRQLDEIEKRIAAIESELKKGRGSDSNAPFGESSGEGDRGSTAPALCDGDGALSVEDEIKQLREKVTVIEKLLKTPARRKCLRLLSIILFAGGLLFTGMYLRGFVLSTDNMGPLGNENVDVIINYPCNLEEGSWRVITFVAKRRKDVFCSSIFVELIRPPNEFYIKDGIWSHEFAFRKTSAGTLEWITEVKYESSDSWLMRISDLIRHRYVDVRLKDADGNIFDSRCIPFSINTFYSALLAILTYLGGILAAVKSGFIGWIKKVLKTEVSTNLQ